MNQRIVLTVDKAFDDPDYDLLLSEFERQHPAEFERWVNIEAGLFARRAGLKAYPDQDLRNLVIKFISDRVEDQLHGQGTSKAWAVQSGRILRNLLQELPHLNPAPGRLLVTHPRTLTDQQVIALAADFRSVHPEAWEEWNTIESQSNFEDDPLRSISNTFRSFVAERCWVQCSTACSSLFLDLRGLVYEEARSPVP